MSSTFMGVSLVLQAVTLVTVSFFLFQLFRAQGRLLLRLDALERGGGDVAEVGEAHELAIGTAVREFQLPDLEGRPVALSGFRGRKVLLVYWSPGCGFCDMLAEELAPMQADLKSQNVEVVLAASGNATANRRLVDEHKLTVPVLLFQGTAAERYITDEVFQQRGTPSAYVLDGEGKVEQGLAVGSDAIVAIARKALQKSPLASLKNSRIERSGIKAGVAAPKFALPDIHGETVALDHFRGRKVLLVFSDPHCGPCDELAPGLVKLHREHRHNGMAVVMVGRGDAEANKKKALQHQMEFPVVLQDRWKLSREYGIFATPVAFLIGNDGVILKNVATGPDAILALAHDGLKAT